MTSKVFSRLHTPLCLIITISILFAAFSLTTEEGVFRSHVDTGIQPIQKVIPPPEDPTTDPACNDHAEQSEDCFHVASMVGRNHVVYYRDKNPTFTVLQNTPDSAYYTEYNTEHFMVEYEQITVIYTGNPAFKPMVVKSFAHEENAGVNSMGHTTYVRNLCVLCQETNVAFNVSTNLEKHALNCEFFSIQEQRVLHYPVSSLYVKLPCAVAVCANAVAMAFTHGLVITARDLSSPREYALDEHNIENIQKVYLSSRSPSETDLVVVTTLHVMFAKLHTSPMSLTVLNTIEHGPNVKYKLFGKILLRIDTNKVHFCDIQQEIPSRTFNPLCTYENAIIDDAAVYSNVCSVLIGDGSIQYFTIKT